MPVENELHFEYVRWHFEAIHEVFELMVVGLFDDVMEHHNMALVDQDPSIQGFAQVDQQSLEWYFLPLKGS